VYTVLDSSRWTVNLSETCRVLYQYKFEKQCISLVFIIRIAWDGKHNSSTAVALTFRRYLSQILDDSLGVLTESFNDLPQSVPRNAEIVP